MSWDITIINGDVEVRHPLGTRDDVVAALADALPGVLMELPPMPPQDMLDIMPPMLRDAAMNPDLEAQFEHNDLSIRFTALDQPIVHWINAEIRGNDDPLPILATLCRPRNWSVLDSGENTIVDFKKTEGTSWDRFREWRDHAFRQTVADDGQETR